MVNIWHFILLVLQIFWVLKNVPYVRWKIKTRYVYSPSYSGWCRDQWSLAVWQNPRHSQIEGWMIDSQTEIVDRWSIRTYIHAYINASMYIWKNTKANTNPWSLFNTQTERSKRGWRDWFSFSFSSVPNTSLEGQ